MKESDFKKITLVGSIIGLIVLYLISTNLIQNTSKIYEIGKDKIGSTINIVGFVDEINFNKGHLFLKLKDETGIIKVVIWNETVTFLGDGFIKDIGRGTILKIRGEIREYENTLEIIPNKNEIEIVDVSN